jgi:NAD(P)-dependent dehydrogenase (short-subunit alcohol dehydrogenase family)
MSLANKTCWVVGGVGVIGRAISRSLLGSGATVIVNSREEERLDRLASDLGNPEKLITVHGSLLPGKSDDTIKKALGMSSGSLNHVVAHGAVRYWTNKRGACDESMRLDGNKKLLDMTPDEFIVASSQLATLHFNAAKELLPKLNGDSTSYTFVTGDGGGHPSTIRSALGELNSYHVWGLSAALRAELKDGHVACREIRVGLPVNRPESERFKKPRPRPLSEDIGDLCAGVACAPREKMHGELMYIDSQDSLEDFLIQFNATKDKNINLPNLWEFSGSL